MSSSPAFFPVSSDLTHLVFSGTTPLDVVAGLLNQGLIDGARLNTRIDPHNPMSATYFSSWLEVSAPIVPSWALSDAATLPRFPVSKDEPWPPLSQEQYINIKSDGVAAALMVGGASPFLPYESLNRKPRLPIDRMVELGLAGSVSAALRRPDAEVESLKKRTVTVSRSALDMQMPYVHAAVAKDAHLLLHSLLEAGFSATQLESSDGSPPLHSAWRCRFAVTQMLLANGADWSTHGADGKTALETWVANLPQDKRLDVLGKVAALPETPADTLWQKALLVATGRGDMEVLTRFWNRAHPHPLVSDPGYWHALARHATQSQETSSAAKSAKVLIKRGVACPPSDAAWLWWISQATNTQSLKTVASELLEQTPAAKRMHFLFPSSGLEADALVWNNTIHRDKLWVYMLNSAWHRRPEVARACGWSGDIKHEWRQPDEQGHSPLSRALESLACAPGQPSIASQTSWESLPQALRTQPLLMDTKGEQLTRPDHHLASALLRLLIKQTSAVPNNPAVVVQSWAYWCDPAKSAWSSLNACSLPHQIVSSLAPLVVSGARPQLEETQWVELEERCSSDPFLSKFWPALREIRLEVVLDPVVSKAGRSPRF